MHTSVIQASAAFLFHFLYNSIQPFRYSLERFLPVLERCGVLIEPRQTEKEHAVDPFTKIIDGVRANVLK